MEQRRKLIGSGLVAIGAITVVVGVLIAHYTNLPDEDEFGRAILEWIPRGWLYYTAGQIIAVGGSQLIVAGLIYGWIFERRLTWALAAFASLIAWFELVLFFGIIPSEWLNLAQGPLGWTSKTAFAIPSWLVLNNEVEVSYAAIKDIISAGYYTTAFIVLVIGVYKVQVWYKRRQEPPAEPALSGYGRPLVTGRSPNGS